VVLEWRGLNEIDSCHVRVGSAMKNHFIPDPPPPPLKAERLGGSENSYHPFIYVLFVGPYIYALLLTIIPNPRPIVKGRTVWGVRKLISAIDLGANSFVVDLCVIFNLQA
jgi:hypothetical protein